MTIIEISNEILKNVNIVEVISHYIKVERKGKNYAALCPFHDDKSLGNFSINQEKGIYKCFACGEGGNAITFVQKIEHCSFTEAVKKTADIIGFRSEDLANLSPAKKIDPKIANLYDVLAETENFYKTSLFQSEDGVEALNYLHNRGLDDETIKYFNIGCAQTNGENLIKYLVNKKFSLQTISDAGLLNLEKIPYKDINAGRIAFTIRDKENKVVGFSCRKYKEGDTSIAKYVNTSDTKVFNKSTILYNYFNAISESRKVGYVYLLEGFMDVIACYRVGIKSAIALMGTALTKENMQLLRYLKCEVRVCLDLDRPGQKNIEKIIPHLEEAGIKYKLVNNDVPFLEKDSDEILAKYGSDKLREYLGNLITKGEWYINFYSKEFDLNTIDGKKSFVNSLLPYMASLNDALDNEEMLNRISIKTGYTKSVLRNYIDSYRTKNTSAKQPESESIDTISDKRRKSFNDRYSKKNRLSRAEEKLFTYLLERRDAYDIYEKRLNFFIDVNYNKIASLIAEYLQTVPKNSDYEAKNIVNYISQDSCQVENKEALSKTISAAVMNSKNLEPYSPELMDELINTINDEKSKMRANQEFEKEKIGKTDEEKAKMLKELANKMKYNLHEKDKNRR